MSLPATPDPATFEASARARWDRLRLDEFDPEAPGDIFSVDTPPPYVSAAHLHVGHAMSYAQADFIVRYQRRRGRRVFCPMGFDDNGLPTERYVEQAYQLDKTAISRSAFRRLCLEETSRRRADYEELWRALGLSVDWRHRYSTIDERCRRIAQESFLQLWRAGRIYRTDAPVQWDPVLRSSLSQADVEVRTRDAQLYEIVFDHGARVATTRPELLPACVALYRHPSDTRWSHLQAARVRVPIFGQSVPVLTDETVRREFGTGLLMVCTFGDADDVERWRRDRLDTRMCVGLDGRLTEAAGPYCGETVTAARRRILDDLGDAVLGAQRVTQHVSVGERSEAPIEWQLRPHWMLRVLDLQDDLLAASDRIRFHPPHAQARLDAWISGLRQDWNLTRQRFYGVPFPVWLCDNCGEAVGAREADLPLDPLEVRPPEQTCPSCNGPLRGDPDVMDTWMTSSMSPWIVTDAPGTPSRPLTLRVQGHEIIRTWLFTTLVKSLLHDNELPWHDVAISGWGLDEQGRKIAKRSLLASNRYDPMAVIGSHGADALRAWAAGNRWGADARYSDAEVRAGRKLVRKLWNVARFVDQHGSSRGEACPLGDRPPEDQWLVHRLGRTVVEATEEFDRYDYAAARDAIARFFWKDLADTWLELVKHRHFSPDLYSPAALRSAVVTGWEVLEVVVGLWAPFLPFVTEELYQRLFRGPADEPSVHAQAWPEPVAWPAPPVMTPILAILEAARAERSQSRQSQGLVLPTVIVDTDDQTWRLLQQAPLSVLAAARTRAMARGPATRATTLPGLRVTLRP